MKKRMNAPSVIGTAYIRYSPHTQDESFNLETQFHQIKTQAAAEGVEIVKSYFDDATFVDENKYPAGITQMLNDASKGLLNIVYVHQVDRLAPQLERAVDIVERLHNMRVTFQAIAQEFHLDTPEDQLIFHLLGSLGDFYPDHLSKEFVAPKRKKRNFFLYTPKEKLMYHLLYALDRFYVARQKLNVTDRKVAQSASENKARFQMFSLLNMSYSDRQKVIFILEAMKKNFDLDTPQGKFLFQLLGLIDDFCSNNLSREGTTHEPVKQNATLNTPEDRFMFLLLRLFDAFYADLQKSNVTIEKIVNDDEDEDEFFLMDLLSFLSDAYADRRKARSTVDAIDEKIDLMTPESNLMFSILGALDYFYSEISSEKKSKKNKA